MFSTGNTPLWTMKSLSLLEKPPELSYGAGNAHVSVAVFSSVSSQNVEEMISWVLTGNLSSNPHEGFRFSETTPKKLIQTWIMKCFRKWSRIKCWNPLSLASTFKRSFPGDMALCLTGISNITTISKPANLRDLLGETQPFPLQNQDIV